MNCKDPLLMGVITSQQLKAVSLHSTIPYDAEDLIYECRNGHISGHVMCKHNRKFMLRGAGNDKFYTCFKSLKDPDSCGNKHTNFVSKYNQKEILHIYKSASSFKQSKTSAPKGTNNSNLGSKMGNQNLGSNRNGGFSDIGSVMSAFAISESGFDRHSVGVSNPGCQPYYANKKTLKECKTGQPGVTNNSKNSTKSGGPPPKPPNNTKNSQPPKPQNNSNQVKNIKPQNQQNLPVPRKQVSQNRGGGPKGGQNRPGPAPPVNVNININNNTGPVIKNGQARGNAQRGGKGGKRGQHSNSSSNKSNSTRSQAEFTIVLLRNIFCQNFDFRPKFRFFSKISIFDLNFDFSPKFRLFHQKFYKRI